MPASRRPAPGGSVAAARTVLFALAVSACASAGAASSGGTAAPPPVVTNPALTHTEADVSFMQGMLAHHRQALEMTSLVPDRAGSDAIRLLAERIEVSQEDEIAQMSRWLESREEPVPAGGAHALHGPAHSHQAPGMLTPEEMARLAAARGAEFDRLFLELMIRHHEGALVMVGELLASPGAAQEPDTYRIVSEIDSDQRIEIDRMQRMLSATR